MLSTCVFSLVAVFSSILCSVKGQDWHSGDGGFQWFTDCDFPGYDIGHIPITVATREQCGTYCIANPECTHFVFGYNENCYMKNAPLTTLRHNISYDFIAICGLVPWRLNSRNVIDDWHVTAENDTNCQFYGNKKLIFTEPCRKDADCATWYKSVTKTPGTTRCKLIDGSLGFCCPNLSKLDIPEQDFMQESKFPKESQWLHMIPNIRQRIIDANSTLTISCTYAFENEDQKENFRMAWEVPDYLIKHPETTDVERRLRKNFNNNGTHMTSTLTLLNVRPTDTGFFGCKETPYGKPRTSVIKQYVYIFDGVELVIVEDNEYFISILQGQIDYAISCRPTHPDVQVSFIHREQYTAQGENRLKSKSNLLEDTDSNWSFNPKIGLKLKRATIDDTGHYECAGTLEDKKYYRDFYLSIQGMELKMVSGMNETMMGTNVTLICLACNYTSFSKQPVWAYWNNKESMQMINETYPPKGMQIKSHHFDYSIFTIRESVLDLTSLAQNHYTFQCQVNEIRSISFRIEESIFNDQLLIPVHLNKGIVQNLTCFKGSINENFQWFKDGKSYSGVLRTDINSSVLLLEGKMEEVGIYSCRKTNRMLPRTVDKSFIVTSSDSNDVAVIAVSVAVVFLFLVGVAAGVKLYMFRKANEIPATFTKRLLEGNVKQIDIQSPIEEQIEFMPYDKRWEFPRHRLKLGIQLGMGCFGRILKAEAVGVKDSDETVKTVAVKMVRSETNIAAMESLISELKILAYLGCHLNVVNLLGACTKKIHKGELLVIIEYCRFGNLQSYLIKHWNSFVNQIDKFGNLLMVNEREGNDIIRGNQCSAEVEDNQMYSDVTQVPWDPSGMNSSTEILTESVSSISREPNGAISELLTESESHKSLWHYQPDHSTISGGSFSTQDLVSWSFQIARGMDYLAGKKVLHGDLAARNILLADNGIAKVADFGMSKKMYYAENYEKKGQGLMPIKWMAVESLTARIFSSQSDVWSYGVVLWELFSLGKVPYPGMDTAHVIVNEIVRGYRMEKPDFAPCFIADIMTSCWNSEPKARPTFRQMEEIICRHMECVVSSSYLNMNEPYVKLNEEKDNARPEDLFGLAKLLREKACSKSTENPNRYSTFPMRYYANQSNDE